MQKDTHRACEGHKIVIAYLTPQHFAFRHWQQVGRLSDTQHSVGHQNIRDE
jgi:hypothetical protein